jgi:hypothetical protein
MNKVRTRYGSYYTAFPAFSYATSSECPDAGNGLVKYPASGSKYGTGKTCDAAKAAYQKAYGKIPVSKPGTGGTDADRTGLNPASGNNQPSTIVSQQQAFNQQAAAHNLPSVNLPGPGSLVKTPGSDDSLSPAGCHNCGDDWWNPGQWGCVLFAKPACEAGKAWDNGWDGIRKFLGDNAIWIAGGGIIAIVFIMALMKRM